MVKNEGIYRVCWDEVRSHCKKINNELTAIIDKLSPNSSFPLYIASYPYGNTIGDRTQFYYPFSSISENAEIKTQTQVAKQLRVDMGYAKNSSPLGMVFHNCVEFYIDYHMLSLPCHIYKPGTLLSLPRELDEPNRAYHPSGLLSMFSGAKSIFSLPNLGNETKHSRLKRDLGISYPAVKELDMHWQLFKDIYKTNAKEHPWNSCLLFFTDKWVNKIRTDKAWRELKLYLYHEAWNRTAFARNKEFYDYAFSIAQIEKSVKADPYISDTIKHLVSIIAGYAPGYRPAFNEEKAPISVIQRTLIESYGIDYCPTIFEADYYDKINKTIYYSLQKPTIVNFSPKARKSSSAGQDMRDLKYAYTKIFDVLFGPDSPCVNTVVHQTANNTEITLYHNKPNKQNETLLSSTMPDTDSNLMRVLCRDDQGAGFNADSYIAENDINNRSKVAPENGNGKILPFADSGPFVRGCVKLENVGKD